MLITSCAGHTDDQLQSQPALALTRVIKGQTPRLPGLPRPPGPTPHPCTQESTPQAAPVSTGAEAAAAKNRGSEGHEGGPGPPHHLPWGLRPDPGSPPGLPPGPGRAWRVSRLSHPGWPCPSEPGPWPPPTREGRVGAHDAGGARASWERGNPILRPAHGPTPPQEGKGSCQSPAHRLGEDRGQTAFATPGGSWALPALGLPVGPALLCLQTPPHPSRLPQGSATRGSRRPALTLAFPGVGTSPP